jgi:hypothetical protein
MQSVLLRLRGLRARGCIILALWHAQVAEEFKGVRLAKKGIRDADEDDYDYLSGAASKSKAKKAAPKPQKVRVRGVTWL